MFEKLCKYTGKAVETLGTVDAEDISWLEWRKKGPFFFSQNNAGLQI